MRQSYCPVLHVCVIQDTYMHFTILHHGFICRATPRPLSRHYTMLQSMHEGLDSGPCNLVCLLDLACKLQQHLALQKNPVAAQNDAWAAQGLTYGALMSAG